MKKTLEEHSSMNTRDENGNIVLQFMVPENLKSGTYTIKINYYYECCMLENGKHGVIIAQSDPIPYTVTFTVQ